MTCNPDSGEEKKKIIIKVEGKEVKRDGLPRWLKIVQGHQSNKKN